MPMKRSQPHTPAGGLSDCATVFTPTLRWTADVEGAIWQLEHSAVPRPGWRRVGLRDLPPRGTAEISDLVDRDAGSKHHPWAANIAHRAATNRTTTAHLPAT